MHRSEKNFIEMIRESGSFISGEYQVIPRDALIRFAASRPDELDQFTEDVFHEILDGAFSLFPKISGRTDLELKIPMAHRYTKFNYVVDPFSIYIPYHYHISELYGLYFREKSIQNDVAEFIKLALFLLRDDRFYERLRISSFDKQDIQSLLKHRTIALGILISLYFEAIYMHTLAHHVIEDISTWYEIIGTDKYSVIHDIKDEEAFCEYVMYESLRGTLGWNEPQGGFALKMLYRLREILVIPPISVEDLMKFLRAYRSVFSPLLYIHRYRNLYKEFPFYKPSVSEEVIQKLSFIFNGFWLSHVTDVEIMKVRIAGKELFERVFLIDV